MKTLSKETLSSPQIVNLPCHLFLQSRLSIEQHIFLLYLYTLAKMPKCDPCNRYFISYDDLDEHVNRHHSWNRFIVVCDACPQAFDNFNAAAGYTNVQSHWAEPHMCQTRDRTHWSEDEVESYMDLREHWYKPYKGETCCWTPRSEATTERQLDGVGHWALPYGCETCNRAFRTEDEAERHMDEKGHYARTYECETCDLEFRTEEAAEKHMAKKRHWANYCRDCDKIFKNARSYKKVFYL